MLFRSEGESFLHAFDKRTGKELWKAARGVDHEVFSSRAIFQRCLPVRLSNV